MPVLYTNNATSTLSAGITNVATSLTVSTGQGARFPAISGSDYFYATLINNSGTIEIVRVTARSGDTLTIVRAQDGTTAAAWNAGDRIELRVTKAMLDDLKADTRAANFTNNLSFNGNSLRITGDLTNATVANRLLFQTSTADSASYLGVIPSGTATNAQLQVMNSATPDNSSYGAFIVNATQVRLTSAALGTGTQLPLTLYIGATEAGRVSTAGNMLLGSVTDNATDKLQVTGSMSLSSALRVGSSPSAGTTGQVLTSQGVGAAPTWSAVAASSLQEFTASGTWTKPLGANFVMVEAWGAGGGGGGGQYRTSPSQAYAGGSGGGGGAYAYRVFKASDLAGTVSVLVGAGGTGGAAGNSGSPAAGSGTNGGRSAFGGHLIAVGGGGGGGSWADAYSVAGGNGAGVLGAGQPSAMDGDGSHGAFGNLTPLAAHVNGRNSGFGGGNGGGSYSPDGGVSIFNIGSGGASYQGGGGGGSGAGYFGSNTYVGGTGGGKFLGIGTYPTGGYGARNGLNGGAGGFREGGGGGGIMSVSKSDFAALRAVVGGSRIVVQDQSTGWAITSTDNGVSWTFLRLPESSSGMELLYVGAEWFLVPINNTEQRILKSSDLATWTTAGFTSPTQVGNYVSYANGVWFCTGSNGLMLTSTDLATWTSRTTGVATTIRHVVWTGTNYVAAAANAGVIYSSNLSSWSTATGITSPNVSEVACNGATVVAISQTTPFTFYSTNNGQTFTGSSTATNNPTDTGMQCLEYLGGNFILLSFSAVYTSTDGNTWTTRTDGTTNQYAGIAYTGSAWFIGGRAGSLFAGISSTDLAAWTSRTISSLAATGGGAGGAGGLGGGGGGGGSCAVNSLPAGAGGAGGNGLVRVYTW